MQIQRDSLLLGFVLGLAVAVLILGAAVVFAPRGGQAAAQTVTPQATRAGFGPGALSTPAPTVPPSPTLRGPSPTPSPTLTPTATPRPTITPTPQPPAWQYQTIEVPPRKFTVFEIPAEPSQTLELTVQVESDIDVTLYGPSGKVEAGPQRVKKSHTYRETSASGGNWGLKLDNSYSWLSEKQVLLQYRLLPAR